jgi:hypothetical protein
VTDKPPPIDTPPTRLVVAAGNRAAGRVPELKSAAEPEVATAARPVIVLAAWVPVWLALWTAKACTAASAAAWAVETGFAASEVFETEPRPTSDAVSVTAPVRAATEVTAADTVPEATERPEPTTTAPAVVVVAAGRRAAGTVPAERSEAEPLVATAARPVMEPAARVVTGAATDTVPSAAIVTLAPCFTPPKTEAVAMGRLYEDGAPERSEYLPEVATVARPVIAVAASVVTGAATEIVPSPPMVVLAPCFTPPKTEAVATGRL